MRATVTAPFVDTAADDLVWSLRHPLVEALAVRTVMTPHARVRLRVLGASHQVLVRTSDTTLVETVACLPGQSGGLPHQRAATVAGASSYTFSSTVEVLGRAEFAARVAWIERQATEHHASIVAAFPGTPLAVTALTAYTCGGALRWRTWHTYPQSGEIVSTTTVVRGRGLSQEADT